MRRVFSTLLLSVFLCLFFLVGVRSDVYAISCHDGGIGGGYYCYIDSFGELQCPDGYSNNYDPATGNFCCQIITGTSCDSCFLPGTLVKSSTGSKKIEDIKVGDKVTSFVDNKITESKVSQIFERKRDFYYSLIAGDYSVKASAEHPFYVGNNKYTKISELKKGGYCLCFGR